MSSWSEGAAPLERLTVHVPERQSATPASWRVGATVLILGILISVAGFRLVHRYQQSESLSRFERLAAQGSVMLNQSIDRYADAVRSIGNLYGTGADVTREVFAAFVGPTLHRQPAIQALAWVPRVGSEERGDVEWAARQDGILDFNISETGAGGTITRAGSRTTYFPELFVEPLDRNKRAVGFDLASDPARRAALEEARDSGRAVLTRRVRLIGTSGTAAGVLLAVPVYRNGAETGTVAQRRAALQGFGIGVFNVGDMIRWSLKSTAHPSGLDVHVFDEDAPPPDRFLAHVRTALISALPRPQGEQALQDVRDFTVFHRFGGRRWKFAFSPAPGAISEKSYVAFFILGAGLLVTAGLTLVVLSGYRRLHAAECLVDQRTVELREMLQKLAESKTALLNSKIETRDAKQRLLSALEASPNGLLLFDEKGKLVAFNGTAEHMSARSGLTLRKGMGYVEYQQASLAGQFTDGSGDDADRKSAAAVKKLSKSMDKGAPATVELRLAPDLWIRSTGSRTAEGGTIAILTDITDLKKSHEALELQAEELKRSNQELEQFAYLASHDMQEPLRVIASFCDLLQLRYADKLDQDGKDFIGYAVDGARRMRSLLDDLLTYSRVGRSEIKITSVSLTEVMEEVRTRLSSVIEDEKAELLFDDLPTVTGDQTLLTQLLQNLVGNGIKFHGNAPPHVRVSAEQGPDCWTISVTDNGIGIEPQYAEKVFQMFQRLHGSDTYAGNGLGLALCKRSVERHGGRIWIEPATPSGTTVKFTLPVQIPNASADRVTS